MDNKVNKNKALYDYSGVPPDAKEEGLFCLYRIEAKSKDVPKKDKIPYTRSGNRADSGNRNDFSSFDEVFFNCDNATVDFLNGKAKAHSHLDYITMINPVKYDPEAYSERVIRFIDEVTSRDKARARFLQKSLSYGFIGLTFFECLFILYGVTNRNGKDTLMEALLLNAGDYGKAVRPETITQKRNPDSQAPSEDIARLVGVRFANISEPARGLVLNSAQVKSMTGNDTQNARFLHENSFDFKLQYKLYINTNYLPVITDMTVFDSNRLYIIPFDRHFEDWEQEGR